MLQDSTQQTVVFTPIGKYATDVTFLHVEIRVPFNHFPEMFRQIEEPFNKLLHETYLNDIVGPSARQALQFIKIPL